MKNSKNIAIIVLIITIIILAIFLLSNKSNINGKSTQEKFLKEFISIQNDISYYVGSTYSDTFGIYDKTQIVIGTDKSDDKTTVNNIESIVDKTQKIEENKKVYYKINTDNIKKVLNITIPEYQGITWYIEDGELLKVKFDTMPEWWTDVFNTLLVGQN